MRQGHERPIDSVAARVVSRGESFEYRSLSTEVCSANPLPIRPIPDHVKDDLSGVRIGRLTVIGVHAIGKTRWVCRCSCGNYALRRTSVILAAPEDSSCAQCYLLAVSKRNELLRRTGKEKHTKEFLK